MTRESVLSSVAALIVVSAAGPVPAADGGDYDKVLGSVHVPAGEHIDKAATVNGSVEIGANAVVKHAEAVNGSVTVGDHATADSVETVNGSINIGSGAHIAGKVELVNGNITLDHGADVGGRLTNVNGGIQLTAAHVGGGIETKNSNLTVGANSRVEGGILYDESSDSWFSFFGAPKVPRVVIGPGTVVKGTLRFRREVKLYVSDQATIGPVEGATAIKFSGASP